MTQKRWAKDNHLDQRGMSWNQHGHLEENGKEEVPDWLTTTSRDTKNISSKADLHV